MYSQINTALISILTAIFIISRIFNQVLIRHVPIINDSIEYNADAMNTDLITLCSWCPIMIMLACSASNGFHDITRRWAIGDMRFNVNPVIIREDTREHCSQIIIRPIRIITCLTSPRIHRGR